MAFVPKLAKNGLFGLAGLAASGAFKKDKNKTNPPLSTGSLATSSSGSSIPPAPSIINSKTLY